MRERQEAKTEKEIKIEETFRDVMFGKLVHEYVWEMEEMDFSENQIEEFKRSVAVLPPEQKAGALALPKEIRRRRFAAIHRQLENGMLDMDVAVARLAEEAKEKGFILGFHLSDKNISPNKNPQSGEMEWNIKGLETDDRDNLGRAYYSLDYENFYRGKPAEYVYVVRAEKGGDSAHKTDEDNHWGRASKLSIIAQFPTAEIDEQVQNFGKQQKTAA